MDKHNPWCQTCPFGKMIMDFQSEGKFKLAKQAIDTECKDCGRFLLEKPLKVRDAEL